MRRNRSVPRPLPWNLAAGGRATRLRASPTFAARGRVPAVRSVGPRYSRPATQQARSCLRAARPANERADSDSGDMVFFARMFLPQNLEIECLWSQSLLALERQMLRPPLLPGLAPEVV